MEDQVPNPPATQGEIQAHDTLAGQRRVNLIWEYTQASIALILVLSTCVAALKMMFDGKATDQVPNILCALVGTVVGSYFQRTNHMNIGGTGRKQTDNSPYIGR